MWDAFARVLTNDNALLVLIFATILAVVLIILAMCGVVRIDTGAFKMGSDYKERDIIRQQTEWAHIFCVGLKNQIDEMCRDIEGYDPYVTMYILERMYSEVVEWITYNHLNLDSDYISIKQDKVKMLLNALTVKPDVFTSKKFMVKVDVWTSEIIHKLVKIREAYK
jgi:hypothetical protein